ncbi:MAG TPA: hypothetical protein VGD36_10980 [Xanthobacteraceae bacterium]
MTITFRCPPELADTLPRPIPAVEGLPEWFKAMPQRAFSELLNSEQLTVKKCPPFIDAMTCGYLIPLASDLRVENGEFSWDREVPAGSLFAAPHSPIDFHDNSQVTGSPFFEEDRVLIKFNGFWTIELPEGYSLLVTHPLNREDLPFRTLTGLVDADRYRDNFLNFPARWRDPDFNGVLPAGTPVAQCVPVLRKEWPARFETIQADDAERMNALRYELAGERDVYRRRFRASKR